MEDTNAKLREQNEEKLRSLYADRMKRFTEGLESLKTLDIERREDEKGLSQNDFRRSAQSELDRILADAARAEAEAKARG